MFINSVLLYLRLHAFYIVRPLSTVIPVPSTLISYITHTNLWSPSNEFSSPVLQCPSPPQPAVRVWEWHLTDEMLAISALRHNSPSRHRETFLSECLLYLKMETPYVLVARNICYFYEQCKNYTISHHRNLHFLLFISVLQTLSMPTPVPVVIFMFSCICMTRQRYLTLLNQHWCTSGFLPGPCADFVRFSQRWPVQQNDL